MRYFLVIDFGATTTRLAVVSEEGNILARHFYGTTLTKNPDDTIQALIDAINKFITSNYDTLIEGISLGAPGTVDAKRGVLVASTVLPGWSEVPLVTILQNRFQLPVVLQNDANLAALGELHFGAGIGSQDMIYMNVSTGVGGGIIAGGELISGNKGFGNELGHISIDPYGPKCSCGNYGCLQALASGTAISYEAKRRVEYGEETLITQLAENGVITTPIVFEAVRRGDKTAIEIIEGAAFYIGVGLVGLIHVLEPELIVLGGGVTKGGEIFTEMVKQTISERAMERFRSTLKITTSPLQDDAGLLGALVNFK